MSHVVCTRVYFMAMTAGAGSPSPLPLMLLSPYLCRIRRADRFFNEDPREFLTSNHVLLKTFLGASRRFGPTSPDCA